MTNMLQVVGALRRALRLKKKLCAGIVLCAGFDMALVSSIHWPVHLEDETNISSRQVILTSFVFFDVADKTASDGIVRFASTLRGSGSQAAVIVFVTNYPDDLREKAKKFGVSIISYTPGVMSSTQLFSSSSVRFWLYHRFMQRYGTQFDYVMTSDVSDVVFQKDPFSPLRSPSVAGRPVIMAALEETLITEDGINGYWVRKCFGAATLERMVTRPVSCSGTTIGDRASMELYIEEMESVQRRNVFCSVQGVDQG
eukprot:CAMPEP_0176474320 /NCGR_PEP_ID=MMETSP0127-20121128/42917_1 /TAXON_ID=938130 /ORGANISM="Platyophrya macrostoma, Strain WH" /LENGTH=254 /DNA_ID=CAMNT_0017869655 /DNA_START=70 /DNA_END=830 /DNA_ORIENTATION=-